MANAASKAAGRMYMELSKITMKRIMLLITFTVLLLVGVQRMDVVLGALGFLWGILSPMFVGAALAFVLNVPMRFIERQLSGGKRVRIGGVASGGRKEFGTLPPHCPDGLAGAADLPDLG